MKGSEGSVGIVGESGSSPADGNTQRGWIAGAEPPGCGGQPGQGRAAEGRHRGRPARSQAEALRGVMGSPGVYKCRKTYWHQDFQLTVLKQLPTEGSWFQGNPNPNAQAFYY